MRCPKPTPIKQGWRGRRYLHWLTERSDQSGEVIACLCLLRREVVAFPTAMPLLKILLSLLFPLPPVFPFFPSLRQQHTTPSTFYLFTFNLTGTDASFSVQFPHHFSHPQLFVAASHLGLFPRLDRASQCHFLALATFRKSPLAWTSGPRNSPLFFSLGVATFTDSAYAATQA